MLRLNRTVYGIAQSPAFVASMKEALMQTIDTLQQLLAYNEWADQRTIQSLKEDQQAQPKALRALTHLLIAEREWLMRLTQYRDTTGSNFWPEMSLSACEALADEVHGAYAEIASNLTEEELDEVATYKNSKGVEYRTKYRDIFLHVLFHSAYHRGQVAVAVRAAGGAPVNTDYIGFVRERDESSIVR
jgi:uncharacterized damage-inducible protein DinB